VLLKFSLCCYWMLKLLIHFYSTLLIMHHHARAADQHWRLLPNTLHHTRCITHHLAAAVAGIAVLQPVCCMGHGAAARAAAGVHVVTQAGCTPIYSAAACLAVAQHLICGNSRCGHREQQY
jgi:hypothetical protein